jgi:hypothetical protein
MAGGFAAAGGPASSTGATSSGATSWKLRRVCHAAQSVTRSQYQGGNTRLTTSTAPASVKPSRRSHMDITLRAPRWHRHIRRTRFAAAPCHEERNAGPAFNLAAATGATAEQSARRCCAEHDQAFTSATAAIFDGTGATGRQSARRCCAEHDPAFTTATAATSDGTSRNDAARHDD